MKVIYSITAILLLAASSFGQCIPDPQYTSPGIYPDSATNLPDARVFSAYNEVVTAIVPSDTVIDIGFGPTLVVIDSINVTSVQNLPPGFSYTCSPPSCSFPGGQSSCMVIQGTPNDTNDIGTVYNLKVYVESFSSDLFSIPVPDSILYYNIRIWYPVGIEHGEEGGFWVAQNQPNPFKGTTSIYVNAVDNEWYDFKVYSAIGELVHRERIFATSGENVLNYDATRIPPGIYLYSISNQKNKFTKRMMVAGR